MKPFIALIAVITLFLSGCGKQGEPTKTTKTADSAVLAYEKDIKDLTELSVTAFQNKLKEPESFLIYLGKPTCEYCQAFVPKLTASLKKNPQTLYYFDVTEADTEPATKELMASLDLEYVPALLRISESGKQIEAFDKKADLATFLKG